MAQINTTGNDDIDTATAEIAVALRAEHPGSNDSYCYRQAERLRDAIMAGTRQLDIDRAVAEYDAMEADWMAGHHERFEDAVEHGGVLPARDDDGHRAW